MSEAGGYVEPAHAPGVRLYFEERGAAHPVTLVLLNGMSQSTANWSTQARHLEAVARVLVYDARGQGRSERAGTRPGLDDHVADLLALLDARGVGQATLVGFSHGARIALRAAAAAPERVARLVLTSTGSDDDAMRRTIVRSWIEVLERGGLEAMAWATLPTIMGRGWLAANERFLPAIVRATVQRNDAASLGALLGAMAAFGDPLADARRVQCPTLLITSRDDLLVSVDSARSLADALDDAEHVLIEQSGHTIPIEQADAWRAHVLRFLGLAD